jgi:uncharacterized protein
MNTLDLTSMVVLGLLGSGHCLGMCGPLILAFPARAGTVSSHVAYHLGRTTTYIVVGAIMGGIGAGLARLASATGSEHLVWVARAQVSFSLVAAGFLLLLGLARLGILSEPLWLSGASPTRIPGVARVLQLGLVRKSRPAMFLMGGMLGFLPCGLSFAAFARALPSGGPLEGGILLLAFAVGTLPALLALGLGASSLARRFRRHLDILSGMLMIGMAASLAMDALQALGS